VGVFRGPTALHAAAYRGRALVAQLLLDAGAAADARTTQGLSPLHVAASRGHAQVVRLLLAAGAPTDPKTTRRVTPLMAAAANGRAACVKLLLARGANAAAAHWHELNSLDLALAHRHATCAKLLDHALRGGDGGAPGPSGGTSARCRRATVAGCFCCCSGGSTRLRVRSVRGAQQRFGPGTLSFANGDVAVGDEFRGVVVAALEQGCFVRFGNDKAASPRNGLLRVRGVPAGSWLQVRVVRIAPDVGLELADK
jgi:hypothetical protein